MLTNNYFCTLKYKIMKGILPVYCRTMGYVVLLLSVFVPLFMFMFGMINDSNLLFTKASIKLLIWFSLFMIFLAKVKDENEKISRIRIKASVKPFVDKSVQRTLGIKISRKKKK